MGVFGPITGRDVGGTQEYETLLARTASRDETREGARAAERMRCENEAVQSIGKSVPTPGLERYDALLREYACSKRILKIETHNGERG